MQNTKLGVSVGFFGAGIFLATLFGGLVPAIILAGYVLLFEQNMWLRRTAVKSVALLLGFSFLFGIIGLIPDFMDIITSFTLLFNGYFAPEVIGELQSVLDSIVSFVKTLLFLGLSIKALSMSTIPVPVIDKMLNKHMVQQ